LGGLGGTLLAVEIALLIVAGTAAGFVIWRFRRRHSGVPRGWQTAQSAAADLHRRVHRCIDHARRDVARAAGRSADVDRLVDFVDDLELQARSIDTQLVAASRLPSSPRERSLRELRYRVIEVEKLATRVSDVAAELTGPVLGAADAGLADLRLRLDALDQARAEAHGITAETPTPDPKPEPEERPGTA
jgi:hypothetical protein